MTLPRLDEGEGRRLLAEALPRRRSLLNRFDRVRRKLDTLLPTQQLQQNKHPLMRTQGTEQSDLIAQ